MQYNKYHWVARKTEQKHNFKAIELPTQMLSAVQPQYNVLSFGLVQAGGGTLSRGESGQNESLFLTFPKISAGFFSIPWILYNIIRVAAKQHF